MSLTRALVFVSVVLGLSLSAHRYVWARLVRDPGWSPNLTRALTATLLVFALAPIAAMMLTRFAPRELMRPLTNVSMIWLGSMLYVLLGVGAIDVLSFVAQKAIGVPFDAERRTQLARLGAGFVALATSGVAALGVAHVLRGPKLRRIRIPLAKVSAGTDGYRIVQVTDIHVGPTIGHGFLRKVVSDVNALDPDLVVITGDLVDGQVSELAEHVRPLADLRARHGVFFVTGNHEYYSGADAWIAHLASLGVRTLRNEHVRIGGADGFDLAGVDDFRAAEFGNGHGPDLARALHGRDASRPVVLLAHQPKQAIEASSAGVDLQLSGHTHAGQIRPFDLLVRLEQRFLEGLYEVGAMKLYVSPGTGYWGPPMRVGTTSEITEITLATA